MGRFQVVRAGSKYNVVDMQSKATDSYVVHHNVASVEWAEDRAQYLNNSSLKESAHDVRALLHNPHYDDVQLAQAVEEYYAGQVTPCGGFDAFTVNGMEIAAMAEQPMTILKQHPNMKRYDAIASALYSVRPQQPHGSPAMNAYFRAVHNMLIAFSFDPTFDKESFLDKASIEECSDGRLRLLPF